MYSELGFGDIQTDNEFLFLCEYFEFMRNFNSFFILHLITKFSLHL